MIDRFTRGIVRAGLAAAALTGVFLAGPAQAQRGQAVDLALVLAVDVSSSMNFDEQQIQRKGYSDAFRHPTIVNAIRSGANRRIAVTYMEWAESANQTIPWTVISNAAEAKAFADKLDAAPIYSARRTSISTALTSAGELLSSSGFAAGRKVIDVSGDGANNSGMPVEGARDALLAKDIVINGLPIIVADGGGGGGGTWFDIEDLDQYYKDCVVGGPGSFTIAVRGSTELQNAIRAKLITEIAGLAVPEPAFRLAQGAPRQPKMNCMIGEQRRGGNFDFNPPPTRFTPLPTPRN